jgi:hypothetical protein
MTIRTASVAVAGCALLAASTLPARATTVLTVGSGGTHTSLDQAMAQALGAGTDHEVRVAAGTLVESVDVEAGLAAHVVVSGGWEAGFSVRGTTPTTIQAAGGRAMRLHLGGDGTIEISALRFTGGSAIGDSGGGLLLFLAGAGRARVERCVFEGNTATQGSAALIAGLAGAVLEVLDNVVRSNHGVGVVAGRADAAMMVIPQETGEFTVARNRVAGNTVEIGTDPSAQRSTGLAINAVSASGAVRDNVVDGNRVLGPAGKRTCGLIVEVRSPDRGSHAVVAERNLVVRNRSCAHIAMFSANDDTTLLVRDTAVAGEAGIVEVSTFAQARIDLINLTVVSGEKDLPALNAQGEGTLTISNSVFVAAHPLSHVHHTGTLELGTNLLTQDAKLVAPFAGDLRPLPGSPVLDAGSATPAGGVELGATDLEGKPRVAGVKVDLGAFERGPGPCVADAETLCLAGGRFAVDTYWRRPDGERGTGQAVPLSGDTG